jgi:hypothetical protein
VQFPDTVAALPFTNALICDILAFDGHHSHSAPLLVSSSELTQKSTNLLAFHQICTSHKADLSTSLLRLSFPPCPLGEQV